MTVPARLSIVTLGVSDLERSIEFYEGLGWPRAESSNEEIAWFKLAGGIVGLFPYESLAEDAGLASAPKADFTGVTLAMCVETPEAVEISLKEAERAGATIIKPATTAEWGGVSGYFADPDGYPWEIAWNPSFPINDDGTIHMP
jgi:catechol 2,3-dioxygenase-like lactoylglutathione lyase family enzyme